MQQQRCHRSAGEGTSVYLACTGCAGTPLDGVGVWRRLEDTEYSGHRVFIRCRPASKADELNGVQYGEVEFQYETSRYTRFPSLTPAGLQWSEWSEWTDFLKPLDRTEEAENAPALVGMYNLIRAADARDRRVAFRKHKGNIQLAWEYSDSDISKRDALMSAADVNRFFNTADAEAAKLRMAEAVKASRAQDEAKLLRDAQLARAKMTSPANPADFYPSGSKRREEQGSPVVLACVGPTGKLLREPVVTDTSGFPDLDSAAIKVAMATRYAAGTDDLGAPLPESCLKFKVKFLVNNN
jgi:hypothetical protein